MILENKHNIFPVSVETSIACSGVQPGKVTPELLRKGVCRGRSVNARWSSDKKHSISCSCVVLIQELDANGDREGQELPRSIHWDRGSARTFPWKSNDIGVNCMDWITCASLEAEFIKHGSIFQADFLNLQCLALTPLLTILNIIFYTCGLALLHFHFLSVKVLRIESWILDSFHQQTSDGQLGSPWSIHALKDAQYLPLQNTKLCRPSFTLCFGEVLLLICLISCKTPLKIITEVNEIEQSK